MISVMFSAVFALFPMLWLSLHALDLSMQFPHPFDSSGAHPALQLGESGGFGSAGCMLMVSGVFAGINVSVRILGVSVHALDAFIQFPQLFVSFAGHFSTMVSGFDCSDSIVRILMVPASSAGVSILLCMPKHTFSMSGWILDPSVLFVWPFALMISGFGDFDCIGCILMISTLSLAISMSYPMLGMSKCASDLCAWPLRPFDLCVIRFAV